MLSTKNKKFGGSGPVLGLPGARFGPGSPRSADCTKYQPRRPILARFRGPAEKSKVSGDRGLVTCIDQIQRYCQTHLQFFLESSYVFHSESQIFNNKHKFEFSDVLMVFYGLRLECPLPIKSGKCMRGIWIGMLRNSL